MPKRAQRRKPKLGSGRAYESLRRATSPNVVMATSAAAGRKRAAKKAAGKRRRRHR